MPQDTERRGEQPRMANKIKKNNKQPKDLLVIKPHKIKGLAPVNGYTLPASLYF